MAAQPTSADADSSSWLSQKANQINIFNEFLVQVADAALRSKWGKAFASMPDEVLCTQELFEHFATFLLQTYEIPTGRKNAGKHLHDPTPVFSGVINQVYTRCCNSSIKEVQNFIKVLAKDQSPQAQWYAGMKRKLERTVFQRDMESGESQDNSAAAITLDAVQGMSAAYAKATDQKKAAKRKLAIKTTFRACGRASEGGFLSYDKLWFDKVFKTPFQQVPQSKTSKVKLIPFVAGASRHSDWSLDWADWMILDQGRTIYAPGDAWINPDIHGKTCGTKVGSFIKALLPAALGGAAEYQDVIPLDDYGDSILPPKPSAAGLRPGACNMLAKFMPAEIGVHTTGHDLRDLSALWEYLEASLALCMPGALVLAGWDAPPWGQIGEGPSPPSLLALIHAGVNLEQLETYMDQLFSFNGNSPPMLQQKGHLRQMVRDATATLIMYFAERKQANEMSKVLWKMEDCFGAFHKPRADATATIIEWGLLIRAKFDLDNLHLTARLDHKMSAQVVAAVQQLGLQQGRMQGSICDQGLRLVQIQDRLREAPSLAPSAPAAASSAAASSSSPAPDAELTSSTPPLSTNGGEGSGASPSFSSFKPQNPAFGSVPIGGGSSSSAPLEVYTCVKDFYLDKTKHGSVPKGRTSQKDSTYKLLASWLDAMCHKEETEVLTARPRDETKAVEIVENIILLVKQYLAAKLQAAGHKVGNLVKNRLSMTTIDEKNKVMKVEVDRRAFHAWRRGEPVPAPASLFSSGGGGKKREASEQQQPLSKSKAPRSATSAQSVIDDETDVDDDDEEEEGEAQQKEWWEDANGAICLEGDGEEEGDADVMAGDSPISVARRAARAEDKATDEGAGLFGSGDDE